MPLVNTFNLACKHKKLDPKKAVPDVSGLPKEQQKAVIAAAKLFIIADVRNDGHKSDWNSYSEEKWYLWWWMNKPGFRLFADAFSSVGSRLCFRTRAIAEHAAKHFKTLYKDLMVQ